MPPAIPLNSLMKTNINFFLKRHFEHFYVGLRLHVIKQVLQMENCHNFLDHVPKLVDTETWGKLSEGIIRMNSQQLQLIEKVKLYFVMKTFLKNQIKLQQNIEEMGKLFLRVENRNKSRLQNEIESFLIRMKINYFSEILIDEVFVVDFLIEKDIILEVNGPSHYIDVFDYNSHQVLENQNTATKTKLLQARGYKVINLAYWQWSYYKERKKEIEFLEELLSLKSFEEIKVLV